MLEREPYGADLARWRLAYGVGALAFLALFGAWIRHEWLGAYATRAMVDVSLTILPAGAAVLCALRVRALGRERRAAWGFLAAACAAWALGNVVWTYYELSGVNVPFPSWADAGYVLLLPLAAMALLVLIVGGPAVTSRTRTVLDGLLIAAAMIFIAYVLFLKSIGHYAATQEPTLQAKVLAVLYPGGDVFLLSLLVLVASRVGHAIQRTLAWLGIGLLGLTVADVGFWLQTAEGSYQSGSYTDIGWTVAFLAIAYTALRPVPKVAPDVTPHPGILLSALPLFPFLLSTTAAVAVYVKVGALEPFLFWMALTVVMLLTARQFVIVLENVQLRRSVEGAFDKLKDQETLRTRTLANILHDLKNPLSPVLLQLKILSDPAADAPKLRHGIQIISRNVEQVKRLVQDLSDVTLLQEGSMKIVRAPCDVSSVVADVMASFQPLAAERQVSLTSQAEGPLPILGDQDRIRQVLVNLVKNALNFTPAGGHVDVEAKATADGVQVGVRDTGRGLLPSEVARLFQPFSQVHERSEAKERGTGLGLYICEGLVSGHGGRIWVESAGRGQGSLFAFTLPTA
ncbi:MAG: sensor histidine kinase [Thermoplasmatota archaeon]